MELQPGPPFNQMTISSLAFTLEEGKNQKKSWFSSVELSEMERVPA